MSGAVGHARSPGADGVTAPAPARPRSPVRLGVTAAVAALVSVATMVAAVLTVSPAPASAGGAAGARGAVPGSVPRGGLAASRPQAVDPLTLTAADRRDCPATGIACVDLARHLTWLQHGGRVIFGPVPMEPGEPGSAHPTPRGTFKVMWKAGPSFVSDIYHEAMPWATFFAAGGIAFHGGSLTQWSHGCVHLTVPDARYYSKHLPIGAEVVVF